MSNTKKTQTTNSRKSDKMFEEDGVFSDTTIDYDKLFKNPEYMDFLGIIIKYATKLYLNSCIMDRIMFLGKIEKLAKDWCSKVKAKVH